VRDTTGDRCDPYLVGIDRLGRNAAEVMTTIRELGERNIVHRSLREGIDTSNATGRMVAGVLASLAEWELELGRERRAAAREARRARGQSVGRRGPWTSRKLVWRSGCTPAGSQRVRRGRTGCQSSDCLSRARGADRVAPPGVWSRRAELARMPRSGRDWAAVSRTAWASGCSE
jgi:Resolvase, N terminal domain